MQRDILITNDDGIESPGLDALEIAFAPLGRVITVAPDREMSATSHRITTQQTVVYHDAGENRYAVEGSPADCVILACMRIMSRRPALVISGVNRGLNLGDDINYSGTVSAAFEAALQGIPAVAVSTFAQETCDFLSAAQVAARLSKQVIEHGLPPDVVLNVNFPPVWNGLVRVTRQGRQPMQVVAASNGQFKVREYSWLEKIARPNRRTPKPAKNSQMTDYDAIASGFVSVTPLHLDRTAHLHIARISDWTASLEGPE